MNVNKAVREALEFYQAGRLPEAEHILKKVVKKDRKNAEAHYHLGRVLQAKGEVDAAAAFYQKATKLDQEFAAAYNGMGNILQLQGRLDEALSCYQRAMAINPHVAVVYNNIGNVLQEKAEFEEAISYYQKAVQLEPRLTMAYENLARAYYGLGSIYRSKGQQDQAVDFYLKSLHLNPNAMDVYYNLGLLYREKGELDEAIKCYQEMVRRDPMNPNALNAIGSVLQKKGEVDSAMEYYRKALRIDANIPEALNNLGTALKERGRMEEAELNYRKALQVNPGFVAALNNLGTLLREKGQLAEADEYYQNAIGLAPDFAEAHWNRAFTNLLAGNFSEGWKEYEWRWKFQEHYLHNLSQPLWDGSDIRERTILLHAEQGLGDTIQFIRYAPSVAERGGRVIVACQKELAGLVQTVRHVSQVVAYGNPLPGFDVHCPLLRLPLVFNTTLETIPSVIPYVAAYSQSVSDWRARIGHDANKFRIGLAWAGRPSHVNDRNRSFPLEIFLPLTRLSGVSFYSLQKGEAAEQAKYPPEGMRILDYSGEIQDFSDTAALIANLDLVISADTAVAHLAGALGRSVWTLLPFAPDWRWMVGRKDSPWYPTMRLFRQPSPGDWKSVMSQVYDALLKETGKG